MYVHSFLSVFQILQDKKFNVKTTRTRSTWTLRSHADGMHSIFFWMPFWCGPFLKIFIEFVTIFLLLYVLDFWPLGMWDLSSPSRNQTHTLCTGRWTLNHWTARKVPLDILYRIFLVRTKPSKTCKSPTSNKYPIITAARNIFVQPQQHSWYHLLTNSPYTTIKPEKL